ncbi:uncharacterized protein LOC105275039 isoform X2 [Ooceraea biroi]|nr:uncharacterized protein LOC105275039 isoform X2 [Ooceraea biroi]XP_011329947.1 uncharacterized protein LOC105275039 isoform X2 [Ooceraea biroi]EZA59798.1 hypothetical protein X777_14370 [Ooceraea biroi]
MAMKYEFERWSSNHLQPMVKLQEMWKDFYIAWLRQEFKPEEKPILSAENLGISDVFWEMLTLSYKVAVLHKRKQLSGETSDSVRAITNKLDELYKDGASSKDVRYNDVVALATAYCNMATVYKNYTVKAQLAFALFYLKRSLGLLTAREADRSTILIVMRASVLLNTILCHLNESELVDKPCPFLDTAVTAYLKYTQNEDMLPPTTVCLVTLDFEDEEELNSNVSLLVLYSKLLSQMHRKYVVSPWNKNSFIKAMHNIVKVGAMTHSFRNKIPWACGLVELARYFALHHRFTEMRDHLAVAQYIMNEYRVDRGYLESSQSSQSSGHSSCDTNDDNFNEVFGSMAQSWGIYASSLLLASTYKLRYKKGRKGNGSTSVTLRRRQMCKPLLFTDFEETFEHITSDITDKLVTSVDDAEKLIAFGLRWFETAKDYFLNTQIPENMIFLEITSDVNIMLKCLTYYETDRSEQIKIHRQRIDLLENAGKACKALTTKQEMNAFALTHIRLMLAYSNLLDSLTEEMKTNNTSIKTMPEIKRLVSAMGNSKQIFIAGLKATLKILNIKS